MKQTFIITLFLLYGLTTYSQPDSVRGHQYRLTGKIARKVPLAPHCGVLAWGTVIEFKVTSIVGMTYKNQNIGIVVTCPADFYESDFFKKGQLYQVTFSDTNQADFGWTVPNASLLKTNQLSFIPYATSIVHLH